MSESGGVSLEGPLFSGDTGRQVSQAIRDTQEDLAQEGVDLVHRRLSEVLREPTGYYEAHINIERQQDDVLVTDSDVIYGPWLEGTSSRNATTRFRGYSTFRLVTQELEARSQAVLERNLRAAL